MHKRNNFIQIGELMRYAMRQIEHVQNEQIPVYALLLKNFQILDESQNSESQHAEIILLERNARLHELDLLVTLEPCPACLFNLTQKGIRTIFFGGFNYQYGACGGKFNLLEQVFLDYKPKIYGGFLKTINENLLKRFFLHLRDNKPDLEQTKKSDKLLYE